MKQMGKFIGAVIVILFAVTQIATAQTPNPNQINLGGYLTNIAGNPLDTTVNMTFSIYNDSIGGTKLWEETQNVTVEAGQFSVYLGSVTPITADVIAIIPDDSTVRWFQLIIGGQLITPRTLLAQTPFAAVSTRLRGDFSTGPNYMQAINGNKKIVVSADSIHVDSGDAERTTVVKAGYIHIDTGDDGTRTAVTAGGIFLINMATADTSLTLGVDAHSNGSLSMQDSSGTHRIELNSHTGQVVAMNSSLADYIGPDGFTTVNLPAETTAFLNNGNLSVKGEIKSGHSIVIRGPLDQITSTTGLMYLGRHPSYGSFSDIKVGIGTTSPGVKLDVTDVVRVGGYTWPVSGKGMEFGYRPVDSTGFIQVYNRDNDTWGNLWLGAGNVGIGWGALPPQTKLHVDGRVFISGGDPALQILSSEIIDPWDGTLRLRSGGGVVCFDGGDNVGIATTTPNTRLDINGDLAIRADSFYAVTGNNNNISIGQRSFLRIFGPPGAFTITGISGGENGKIVILYNATAQNMTIANESANSLAANRILTMSGANEATVGTGNVTLIYDFTGQRWIVTALKP
jgi:hypothetical protein